MLKLIRSEFVRMFRYSSFIKFAVLDIVFNLIAVYFNYLIDGNGTPFNNDASLFVGLIFMVYLSSIMISSFIGTEFSCGTIRNKLIAGKQHYQVYIADYIVCFSTVMLFELLGVGISYGIGNIVSTLPRQITMHEILMNLLYSVPIMAFFVALFLFIPMTVHKHSTANLISVLTASAMLLAPLFLALYSQLYDNIINTISEHFPTTGLYSLVTYETEHISGYIITSAVSAVILIAAGICVFKKKNTK